MTTVRIANADVEITDKPNGECPFVDHRFIPDPAFNEPVTFESSRGDYVFYKHFDGFDTTYNAQFCMLCGRVRDVFRCFNTSEWHECPYYKSGMSRAQEPQP